MRTFKEFLQEADNVKKEWHIERGVGVDLELIEKKILTLAPLAFEAARNGVTLYRGDQKVNAPFAIIDTENMKRSSVASPGTYMKALESLPEFSDIVPRSKALICSGGKNIALGYARNNRDHLYVALPFDNARISYGAVTDVLFSEVKTPFGYFNLGDIERLVTQLMGSRKAAEAATFEEIVDKISNMSEEAFKAIVFEDAPATAAAFLELFSKSKKDFLSTLYDEMFKGMKLQTISTSQFNNAKLSSQEIWVSGKILLVQLKLFSEIVVDLGVRERDKS